MYETRVNIHMLNVLFEDFLTGLAVLLAEEKIGRIDNPDIDVSVNELAETIVREIRSEIRQKMDEFISANLDKILDKVLDKSFVEELRSDIRHHLVDLSTKSEDIE